MFCAEQDVKVLKSSAVGICSTAPVPLCALRREGEGVRNVGEDFVALLNTCSCWPSCFARVLQTCSHALRSASKSLLAGAACTGSSSGWVISGLCTWSFFPHLELFLDFLSCSCWVSQFCPGHTSIVL